MRLNIDLQTGNLPDRVRRSEPGDDAQAGPAMSPGVQASPSLPSEGVHSDRPTMADGASDATKRIARMTDDLLRRALWADARGLAPDRDLQRALRQLCTEARDQGLRAEQLLVLMKSRWRQVPEARRASRDAADGMFAVVVTLCIREYYASECYRDALTAASG